MRVETTLEKWGAVMVAMVDVVEGSPIPQEYRHLSGLGLDEAREWERSHDREYLKKVRRPFLFENRLDDFKRLARRGRLDDGFRLLFVFGVTRGR